MILIFFLVLGTTFAETYNEQGTPCFLKPNNHYVYNYEASIQAGSQTYSQHASVSYLKGQVHLKKYSDDTVYIWFANLTHQLYNGKLSENVDNYATYAADDLLAFEKAGVLVKYNSKGTIDGIQVDSDEKPYVTNVKKAIASVWQINPFECTTTFNTHAYQSSATENSIYGPENVFYNIESDHEKYRVQKFHTGLKDRNYVYKYGFFGNKPSIVNPTIYEEPLSYDNQKVYIIDKKSYVIETIDSTGGIYFYPLKGKSFSQYVYVKQKFTYLSQFTEFESTLPKIDTYQYYDGLEYKFAALDTNFGNLPDVTGGRGSRSVSPKIIRHVIKLLSEIGKHFHDNNIDATVSQKDLTFTPNEKIYNIFEQFTFDNWKNFYVQLETDTSYVNEFRLVQKMLPYIGTKAATMLIRDLVKSGKVKENLSVYWFSCLAQYVKVPTMEVVEELDDVFTWQNVVTPKVYRVAMLSFATLLNRVHSKNDYITKTGQDHTPYVHEKSSEETYRNIDRYHDQLEKYIQQYVTLLKSAKEYNFQILYIHCLHNIGLEPAIRHLEPIIRGVEGYIFSIDRHLRLQALYGSFKTHMFYPKRLYEIYYPIFANKSEHTELRMGAYLALMTNVHLSYHNLLNIFWYMNTEKDSKLYNLHYTTLKSLSESTAKFYHKVGLLCRQILKFTAKPAQQTIINSNNIYDYRDPEYGYGGGVQLLTAVTGSSAIFFSEFSSNCFNVPFNIYSVFLKIDGFDSSYSQLSDITNLMELNEIFKFIKSLSTLKHLRIEYIVTKHDNVIQADYYDHSNINEFYRQFWSFDLKQEVIKTYNELEYLVDGNLVTVSALGTPVILKTQFPKFSHYQNQYFLNHNKNNYHFDFFYQGYMHGFVSLSYYNPFTDLFHGVRRNFHFDYSFPIYMDIVLNIQQQNMKISFTRSEKKTGSAAAQNFAKDIVGIENYVYDFVYVSNYYMDEHHSDALLNTYSPTLRSIVYVTKGAQHQKTVQLFNYDFEDFGTNFEGKYFSCEKEFSINQFWNEVALIGNKYTKNYHNNGPVFYFLTARNLFVNQILSPSMYNCGTMFRLIPSKQHPVSRIDTFHRLNIDNVHVPSLHLPGYKLKYHASVSIKADQPDKVLKTWDSVFSWVVNPNHDLYHYSLHVYEKYATKPGIRFCFFGNGQYGDHNLHTNYNVSLGYSTELQCVSNDGFIIFVTGDGKYSKEQELIATNENELYPECAQNHHFLGSKHHSIECADSYFSLNDYVYDITVKNLQSNYEKHFSTVFQYFYGLYGYQMTPVNNAQWTKDNSHFKFEVNYPVWRPGQVDVTLYTPSGVNQLDGLDNYFVSSLGFDKENLFYSSMFKLIRDWGLTQECTIDSHGYLGNRWTQIEPTHLDKGYILLAGDSLSNPKYGVYGQLIVDAFMKIKVIADGTVLEIIPHTSGLQITVNGQEIKDRSFNDAKFFYKIVRNNYIFLKVHNFGIYLEYDSHVLHLDFPIMKNVHLVGHCFHNY